MRLSVCSCIKSCLSAAAATAAAVDAAVAAVDAAVAAVDALGALFLDVDSFEHFVSLNKKKRPRKTKKIERRLLAACVCTMYIVAMFRASWEMSGFSGGGRKGRKRRKKRTRSLKEKSF